MGKFVTVDVETSGLNPNLDKIVEIAAVWRLDSNRLVYASNLINPGTHIPPDVSGINHLTDDDVKNAPSEEYVISEQGFPKGIIVCHNVAFDKNFLPDFLQERQFLCTLKCAKHLYPDSPNHKNMTLRYYLGVKPDLPQDLAPHRALYDALVTNAILEHMLVDNSLDELLELQSKPVLLKSVKFGKHRGQLWTDIPKDYLRWMLSQDSSGGIDEDIRHTARYWLQR